MKRNIAKLLMALALALPAVTSPAQDAGQPRPPRGPRPAQGEDGPQGGPQGGQPGAGPGQRMQVPPLMAALDTNRDGVIDEKEIASASAALRKLDKNGDGKLTMDELRPQRPGGPGGQGGPGDEAGPRGPRPPQDGTPPGGGQDQPRPRRQKPAGE